MKLPRRDFVKKTLELSTISLCTRAFADTTSSGLELPVSWSNGIPPLYCNAHIDPTLTKQRGQEANVAKYPLAIVPQDQYPAFVAWRNKVRDINPNIKLLGYHMVAEDHTVPGPGHDIMRKLSGKDTWITYPGGFQPTTTWMGRSFHIYDYRNTAWQTAFLEACEAVMHAYPYDGLLLDNCSVYTMASLLPNIRAEMLEALKEVLVKLRKRLPNAIIIANSNVHYSPLNGSMNENRPFDLRLEASNRSHHEPVINMYQFISSEINPSEESIRKHLELALNNKCFFGVAAILYQKALWPKIFDEVLAAYKNPPSPVDPLTVQPDTGKN